MRASIPCTVDASSPGGASRASLSERPAPTTLDCTSWYSFRADRFLGLESSSLGRVGQNDVQLRVLRLPGDAEDRLCAVRSVSAPSPFQTYSSRPRLVSSGGVLSSRAATCL